MFELGQKNRHPNQFSGGASTTSTFAVHNLAAGSAAASPYTVNPGSHPATEANVQVTIINIHNVN